MKEIIDILVRVKMGQGIIETLYMVMVSAIISFLLGMFIGVLSAITDQDGLCPNKIINQILGIIINLGRSIPFIILMIALTPFTRWLVGKSYGSTASIVSLTIAAIPFVSRLIEGTIKEIDKSLIESVIAMGASLWQVIVKVYFWETTPALVRNFSLTTITLIGYSAMAGAIGGDGLGNIAITYGYHRFDNKVMFLSLVIIVLLVQVIQIGFEFLAKKIDKK